jgi:hypothetical protein
MAAVRDIIIHVEVQVASAKRTCHHNQKEHGTANGQKCLAIHDGDGCAKELLLATRYSDIAQSQDKAACVGTRYSELGETCQSQWDAKH